MPPLLSIATTIIPGSHLGEAGAMMMDSDLAAHIAATGATDTVALAALVSYLKAQSLWASSEIYPMKAAQNFGSGSTVRGLGGITTNNMTLVNSPTWGAGGITMNNTTQFGHIADFLDADTITVFVRRSGTLGVSGSALIGQWNTASARSWLLSITTSSASLVERSAFGEFASNREAYTGGSGYFTTSDVSYSAQWVSGGGRSAWKNNVTESLTLTGGTAQTARFNSSDPIILNARGTVASPTAFLGGTYIGLCIVRGTITTTQREQIDTLLRAL